MLRKQLSCAHINYVIHLMVLCLWIPHNYDLERCGDCVSETCLLRQSNAKSIFQKDSSFCQTLTCCCSNAVRRGKRSVMQLIYKNVWRTRNPLTAAPPFAARQTKRRTKILRGYNAIMSSESMICYKNMHSQTQYWFLLILFASLV